MTYQDRLRKKDYEVRPTSLRIAQEFVANYHYSQGGSNTAVYIHGLFHKQKPFVCLGIAWWIPPIKGAASRICPEDWQKVLSLSRLVVVPGVPKNAAGFLIAQSIKHIAKEGKFSKLLTYADTWQGHTGCIYKATNWRNEGLTEPTECWVTDDGRMVSRKAGPKTRTKAEMEALGYKLLGKFPKIRFVKDLTR